MKIGIMQPYFLPYLGYFSLIKHTERYILLDEVQFMRHGWIERNRILNPNEGWMYIAIPLIKHSRDTLIKNIKIDDKQDWRSKIFRQMEHYKKRAPFYNEVIDLLDQAFDIRTESIVSLNKHVMETVCAFLEIKTPIEIYTDLNMNINEVTAADEWALKICEAIGGVDEYWNPEGGIDFFNREKYLRKEIQIKFLKSNLQPYRQGRSQFEPGLSIIDVMMFNDKETVNRFLDDFTLM